MSQPDAQRQRDEEGDPEGEKETLLELRNFPVQYDDRNANSHHKRRGILCRPHENGIIHCSFAGGMAGTDVLSMSRGKGLLDFRPRLVILHRGQVGISYGAIRENRSVCCDQRYTCRGSTAEVLRGLLQGGRGRMRSG